MLPRRSSGPGGPARMSSDPAVAPWSPAAAPTSFVACRAAACGRRPAAGRAGTADRRGLGAATKTGSGGTAACRAASCGEDRVRWGPAVGGSGAGDGRASAARRRLRRRSRRPRRRPPLRPWRRPAPCRRRGAGEARQGLEPGAARQAGVRGLEPGAHALPRAEEQRLDRGARDRQRPGELLVREPAELAQQQRVPLLARQLRDRALHIAARSALRIASASGSDEGALTVDLGRRQRLAHARADARPALVARDRREPGGGLPRLGAVQERAVRGEERLLRRVLSLGAVAQQRAAQAADEAAVVAVELLGPRGGRPVIGAAVGANVVRSASRRCLRHRRRGRSDRRRCRRRPGRRRSGRSGR